MSLFTPLLAGELRLANRLVMAPLTRMRAGADGIATPLIAEHYAQRASLGLIITEGVYPSAESRAYAGQPGIIDESQAAGWRRVADAVHAEGGTLVMQLMHGGRVSHPDITGTERIVGPSAVPLSGLVRTSFGKVPYPVPHPLSSEELAVIRDEFVAAARRAVEAGFDGVELHGANGYLLHDFLSPVANRREDGYGGSAPARARFVVEVVEAVAAAVGAGKVGLRLSPEHDFAGPHPIDEADTLAGYEHVVRAVAPLDIAYLSLLHRDPTSPYVQRLRASFGGVFVINNGFERITTREEAAAFVDGGLADAVAVGRAAIANPDLARRWREGHAENAPDPASFYTPGDRGYTDYPRLDVA